MSQYLGRRRSTQVTLLHGKLANYFINRQVPVSSKYPYIIHSRNNWDLNIIDPRVVQYIKGIASAKQSQRKPFPLHKYIHHGLSSQAFLFNLICPVVIDSRYDVITDVLSAAGASPRGVVNDVHFEVEDRSIFSETTGQPTSIDLVIETSEQEKYFVEFKFTEAEFGGCSLYSNGDCDGCNPCSNLDMCILHDMGRQYWNKMNQHGLITQVVQNESRCPFIDLYQAIGLSCLPLRTMDSLFLCMMIETLHS